MLPRAGRYCIRSELDGPIHRGHYVPLGGSGKCGPLTRIFTLLLECDS